MSISSPLRSFLQPFRGARGCAADRVAVASEPGTPISFITVGVSGHPLFLSFSIPSSCPTLGPASQLRRVVQDRHLLARLEGRQADVGAIGAAEGVAKRAAAARARLALHGEVELGQVVGLELERGQAGVGLGAPLAVARLQPLRQPARAVLARAPLLARLGLALGRWRGERVSVHLAVGIVR